MGTAERVEIIFRYPSLFVVSAVFVVSVVSVVSVVFVVSVIFVVPILLKLSKFTISALLAIIKTLR